MDYFQGVVTEFLRANRSTFVNTECLIQLQLGDTPEKDKHWFCDVVAINFSESTVYLCEVSYSGTLAALMKRLKAWAGCWPDLKRALVRDCHVPADWKVLPWVFIPRDREPTYQRGIATISGLSAQDSMSLPKLMFLEDVVPWKYRSWDRKLERMAEEGEQSA